MMQGFDTSRSPIISGLRGVRGLGQDYYGDEYTAAVTAMQTSDASQGVDTSAPWYQDLIGLTTQALTAYTQFRSQDAIMELNVERARNGLPPIDPTAYGPAVGVGLDARTRELLQYAMIGGGLLALFLIMKKR